MKIVFDGEDLDEILNGGVIKYALIRNNVNLYNEFANRSGSIDHFLNDYGFVGVTSSSVLASLSNVDNSYYLWVYVKDLLNNYGFRKVDGVINLDTKAPSFDELGLSLNKVDTTEYDLVGEI